MSWLDRFAEIRSRDWSQVPDPERSEMAREVVQMTAYASAAAAVVPIPFTDLALLLPFHTAMVMTVGHVFGRNLTDAEAKRVAIELGTIAGVTIAGRVAISVLKKLVLPGIGGLLAAPASFAVTWAFGRLTIAYFKDPELSREDLDAIFKDAMKEGSKHFSKEAFDRFRRSQSDGGDKQAGPNDERGAAKGAAATGPDAPTGHEVGSDAADRKAGASQPPGESGATEPETEAVRPVAPADPTLKTKKRSL